MRVGIADDSALFREGLAALLRASGIDVIISAARVDEICEQVKADPPDVVIMDLRMPPSFTDEGLIAARRIRKGHPDIGVLVFSGHVELSIAALLFEEAPHGLGYLLKDTVGNIEDLKEALTRLSNGEIVVDPTMVSGLLARRRRKDDLNLLSAREHDVLRYLAEGKSNVGIAQELGLSPHTVEVYLSHIFNKLDIQASPRDNRRVLAVLEWLRATSKA